MHKYHKQSRSTRAFLTALHNLKIHKRLVIPLGGQWLVQQLKEISKDKEGNITERAVLPVSFVPLTGSKPGP